MGLRIALGAQPKDVLALVLRESLGRVAFGMALGLTGAVALTPASIEPALSRRPARSRDLCGSLCSPSRNGRRRGDRAGKARDTGRPDGRFEVGVTAHPSHRVIFWRRPCQLQRWLTPLCPGGHSQQRVRRRTTRANHGPSSRVYRPNTPFAATVMPTRRNEGPSFCTIRAQPHQPLRATSPIASR